MALTSVKLALPRDVVVLDHVVDAVTAYLLPPTLDNAVRSGAMPILIKFPGLPCSCDAASSAMTDDNFDVVEWTLVYHKFPLSRTWRRSMLDQAVKHGQARLVTLLADKCEQSYINQMLEKAAKSGEWAVVTLLADKCAEHYINQALIQIVEHDGPDDVMRFLISKSDDPYQAMNQAVETAKWGIVTLLADKCKGQHDLNMALQKATESGEWTTVTLLADKCGQYYINEALKKIVENDGPDDVMRMLISKSDDPYQAMNQAVETAKWGIVTQLADKCGQYYIHLALQKATESGELAAVTLLVDKCKRYSINEALTKAVENDGPDDVMRLLISESDDTYQAMYQAVKTAKWGMVILLADKCEQSYIKYALKKAVELDGPYEVMRLLISKIDDSNEVITDNGGKIVSWTKVTKLDDNSDQFYIHRALKKAIENGDSPKASLLFNWYWNFPSRATIEQAARSGDWVVVKLLLNNASVSCVGFALGQVAKRNAWNVVRCLASQYNGHDAGFAMQQAARYAIWDVTKILVDKCGALCVGLAIEQAARHGEWAVVEFLLAKSEHYGCGFVIKRAAYCSNWNMVKLLVDRCSPFYIEGGTKNVTFIIFTRQLFFKINNNAHVRYESLWAGIQTALTPSVCRSMFAHTLGVC